MDGPGWLLSTGTGWAGIGRTGCVGRASGQSVNGPGPSLGTGMATGAGRSAGIASVYLVNPPDLGRGGGPGGTAPRFTCAVL